MAGADARERLGALLAAAADRVKAQTVTQVSEKGAHDYVTNVDHDLDAFLSDALPRVAPGPVLSEERKPDGAEREPVRWLIDPLDGTHNLRAGIPYCAVSAAYFEGADVALGGICDVATGDIYLAGRGAGAWLNGQRLSQPPEHSGLIALSTDTLDFLVRDPETYARLRAAGKFRNFGAQALQLCWVASGLLALNISYEARLWDIAAGRLIAEEAGARYVGFGDARMTAAGMSRPSKTVCGHPAMFDMAAEMFGRIWRTEDKR